MKPPTCTVENCGRPAVYTYDLPDMPVDGTGENVVIGTVADLHPELLEDMPADLAETLGQTEVIKGTGDTETVTIHECAEHGG